MPMPPMLVLILVPLLPGLWLVTRGLRGRRVGDHPYCRACGFDLFGLPRDRARCPECGAALVGPRAVVVGQRQRRAVMTAGGVTLLVVAASVATVWFEINGGRIDPYQYEPAWLLARQATQKDSVARNPAMGELAARLSAGRLSRNQAVGYVDRMLTLQADTNTLWDVRWGDFVEGAQLAGLVDDTRWQRYASQAVSSHFTARPRVRWGDPIPIALYCGPLRAASRTRLHAFVDVDWLRMLDHEFKPTVLSLEPTWMDSGVTTPLQPAPREGAPASLGAQAASAHIVTRIFSDTNPLGRNGTFICEHESMSSAVVEMLPASASSVVMIRDEYLAADVQDAVSVEGVWSAGTSASGEIAVRVTPINLCCDLYIAWAETSSPCETGRSSAGAARAGAFGSISIRETCPRGSSNSTSCCARTRSSPHRRRSSCRSGAVTS